MVMQFMEAQSIPNIIRTAVRLSPPWTLPLWLFIAMVLVGIVITAYLLLHRHRVWASICGALRLIALLILLFLMARPIWQRSTIREQPATIVIALDTSKSMTLPMDNATRRRRIDSALKLLFGEHDNPQGSIDSEVQRRAKDASVKMQSKAKTSLIAHLKGRFQVELYRFDEDAVLLTGRAKFDHPKANGRMTDLRKLLVAVKRNVPRRKLAGIILLTDGADNCARDEREIVATARALGVPVFAIGFGAVHHQRELTPNLSIAEVLSNERVIAGSTVRAIVTVRANHVNTPT
ncbi:MAG TPA: VWA domain-containing protein, partial [Armatimonadetes bacterium]|nr:VWA domain-containing protein [Armatimonadota bacterium]